MNHRSGWLFPFAMFVLALVACAGCAAPRSVYLGDSNKTLYALLGKDGTLRWKQPVGGEIHTRPLFWKGGNVYVAASDGVVYAFDADKATLLWQTQLMTAQQASGLSPQSVLSSPIMPVNGILFVGTGLGDVFELNGTTGAKTLRASLGAPGRQWLAASNDGSLVWATSTAGGGTVYEVSRANGGILWKQTGVTPTGPAAQGVNNGLWVPAQSGVYILAYQNNGQQVTSYTKSGLVEGVVADTLGAAYISTSTGNVQQIWGGGALGWTANITNAACYAPLLFGSTPNITVVVTTVNGYAATIIPNSGGIFTWNVGIDTDLAASPTYSTIDASSTPAVLVVTTRGTVYALNPQTAATIWKQANVVSGRVDAAVVGYD